MIFATRNVSIIIGKLLLSHVRGVTVRVTFYVVIQMSLPFYWHAGNIFVKRYRCFLELAEKSSTQDHIARGKEEVTASVSFHNWV